ncbi:hypothetical protein YIM_24620 [Amycolatopsis sp. YIM 10]|nr:hypothetical protein YIM_24620 [Amycolatopsis sp. YIM 10]
MRNRFRRGRIAGVAFAATLTALCALAPPTSAAPRTWSPDPRDASGNHPSLMITKNETSAGSS